MTTPNEADWELINAYSDGELPAEEARALEDRMAAEPELREMLDEVRDWSSYHPPEVLPNGDIIIRKKQVEPETPQTPAPQDDPPPGMTDI